MNVKYSRVFREEAETFQLRIRKTKKIWTGMRKMFTSGTREEKWHRLSI